MSRRIYFARVNRRADNVAQESFGDRRAFAEDIEILRDASPLRFPEQYSTREWIIADLEYRGADNRYLVGLLGYTEEHTRRDFDEDNHSWSKGRLYVVGGADARVIVPFAVDTSERRRHIAYATSNRLSSAQFISGFAKAVNKAVAELRLWPVDWDIDPITLREDLFDWLSEHPEARVLTRIVRPDNPGGDLSDMRARLRAIAAKEGRDRYTAHNNSTLRLTDADGEPTEEMRELSEGLEEGDVRLEIETRRGEDGIEFTYRSWERAHYVTVEDWEDDLSGMAAILQQLVAFEQDRAAPQDDPEAPQTPDNAP